MPIAMTSAYSALTEGARLVIEHAYPHVDAAIETLPTEPAPVLVDYGAADGGTAVGLWERVTGALLARPRVEQIQLWGNDLPANDHGALARSLGEVRAGREHIFVGVLPTSFYEPVLPPGSVSFGFSATAMHWLSTKPRDIADHTHANATTDTTSRQDFAAQAQTDWRRLMAQRARELRPGAQMVLVNLSRTDDGRYLGHNGRDRSVHDTLHDIWKGLAGEGVIDGRAYASATFQNYYKRESEFTAVFDDPTSIAHQAGLRVRRAETDVIRCPYRVRFEADRSASRFADGLMRTVRSWSEHTFNTATEHLPNGRHAVDELYRRFAARIEDEPSHYSMDYVETYLWVEKQA